MTSGPGWQSSGSHRWVHYRSPSKLLKIKDLQPNLSQLQEMPAGLKTSSASWLGFSGTADHVWGRDEAATRRDENLVYCVTPWDFWGRPGGASRLTGRRDPARPRTQECPELNCLHCRPQYHREVVWQPSARSSSLSLWTAKGVRS